SRGVEEFSETQLGYVPLFVGGDAEFRVAFVRDARAQGRENLFGRAARGSDDEDEAEALFVLAVRFDECRASRVGSLLRACLFALRPTPLLFAHLRGGLRLAYLRVRAERFEPVVGLKLHPDAVAENQDLR